MNIFHKYEINPFSVSDKVRFRNVDKVLDLTVRADAGQLVADLKKAQDKLSTVNEESQECEKVNVARYFAKSIFGEEQADRLVDFYNEPLTVISVCGEYFKTRLSKLITKAQKRK